MDNGSKFSSQLQNLRRKKGVTQEQLANYVSVSPQAVSKWENGSYPDGELLPKIADFFGVTIDELFGRGCEAVPLTQAVVTELSELYCKEDGFPKVIDRIMQLAWATIIPCWRDNKYYWEAPDGKKLEMNTGSFISHDKGFVTMRHNSDMKYYMVFPEPDGGYTEHLNYSEEIQRFFTFLGDADNLKIVYYMNSLKRNEYVTEKSVAKNIGISLAKTSRALEFLYGKKILSRCSLEVENGSEIIYCFNQSPAFVMLLAGIIQLVQPVEAYHMQVNNREHGYFERAKLSFMKKK